MKKNFLKMAFVSLFTVVALGSCSKDDETDTPPDVDDFVAVTAITEAPAIAEVNVPLTLSATVSPSGATNQTIVWTIKDAGTTGAVIASGGNILTATATGNVVVTATIAGGATRTTPFTADFTIEIKSAEEIPSVTGVTISPATTYIYNGDSQTFTATLTGNNLEEADQAVTWTLTGRPPKAGTAISADGVLTIAADETLAFFTVTATSVLDNSKSGTADVIVNEKPEETAYFGTWKFPAESSERIIINYDKIEFTDANWNGFIMINLTWTQTVNLGGDYTEDYPAGYRVTGILKRDDGYSIPKVNGSGSSHVGDFVVLFLYLSTDKQSVRIGNMETAEHEAAYGPYEKTANVEYRQVSWDLNGGEWTADDNHATQTTKDGKLYAPIPPTKTDNIFGGWYTDPSLRYKADFPYDVRSVTEDFTLYAKWYVASEPSSKLSYLVVSAEVLGYNYISVQRETDDGSFENAYSIPTEPGTGEIDVLQGVYRIEYSFWTCLTDDCTVTLYSYTFYVPAGETREIQIIGSSVIR